MALITKPLRKVRLFFNNRLFVPDGTGLYTLTLPDSVTKPTTVKLISVRTGNVTFNSVHITIVNFSSPDSSYRSFSTTSALAVSGITWVCYSSTAAGNQWSLFVEPLIYRINERGPTNTIQIRVVDNTNTPIAPLVNTMQFTFEFESEY